MSQIVVKCVTTGCVLNGREQTVDPTVRLGANVYGRLDPICSGCNVTMVILRKVAKPQANLGEQFLDDLQKTVEDRIKAQGEWQAI